MLKTAPTKPKRSRKLMLKSDGVFERSWRAVCSRIPRRKFLPLDNLSAQSHFRPVRTLAIPGRGEISLMRSYRGMDSWFILFVSEKSETDRSRLYRGRQIGERVYREVASKLARTAKDKIARDMCSGKLTPAERGRAAIELGRLCLADDNLSEAIRQESEKLCNECSLAECESHLALLAARVDALRRENARSGAN
jgi:hypothetical protein